MGFRRWGIENFGDVSMYAVDHSHRRTRWHKDPIPARGFHREDKSSQEGLSGKALSATCPGTNFSNQLKIESGMK